MGVSNQDLSQDVTSLLAAWSAGESEALERLMPLVYDEIRRIAAALMAGERGSHTLQPTALANEVYLRLVDQCSITWRDRTHFFALTASLMRRLLIDHARKRATACRGGGQIRIPLGDLGQSSKAPPTVDLLDLDRALEALETEDETAFRLVELRFYGGLSIDEAAEVLAFSGPTAVRRWRQAKQWLLRHLQEGSA